MTYFVTDVETTIHSSFKRKANPFDPRNWVVLAGWKAKGDDLPSCLRYTNPQPDPAIPKIQQGFLWLVDALEDEACRFVTGANIKFDMLYMLQDPAAYKAWQGFVQRGGVVWDIQLAEYLLDGQIQSSHILSLDEMALRYGCDLKVDEVKKLWEAGVPTEEIDPDLLKRYLIGEELRDPLTGQPTGLRREGDIGNTEAIFLKQIERAKKSGQSRSIIMNMGSLCATIEMERNGMFVDKELGLAIAAEVAEELLVKTAELNSFVPAIPFEFNWNSRFHKSALIFGGKVKYERRSYELKNGERTFIAPGYLADEEDAYPAHAKDDYAYTQKDVREFIMEDGTTQPLEPGAEGAPDFSLFKVSKGGKNAGEPKSRIVKRDDYDKPKSRMDEDYWTFDGFTEPVPEWEGADKGVYSTSADVIESLGERTDVPFLATLGAVAALTKDLGTYFITTDDDGVQKGMLTLVQLEGIIHHMINHTSTVTARLSSSNPNLQNLSKGNKSRVKEVFVSRFGKKGRIIQSDFSSLEVYIQAILTRCVNLIADLKAGLDLHCVRLTASENSAGNPITYDEVKKLAKGWKETLADGTVVEHAPDKEWDYKRTGAKVFSFQRQYGAGNKKIAASTGMKLEEVEALADAEALRYPETVEYPEKLTEQIKRNRKPTSTFVPHPDNAAITCQLGLSRIATPDGKLYTFREQPAPEYMLKRGVTTSFSPTEIKNYPMQGAGGEVMKAAMWISLREWYRLDNFGGLSLLVNTVHDAEYADTHEDVLLDAGTTMQACMESASDFMTWYFKWDWPLPVPTDTSYGMSMAEEKSFDHPDFKSMVREKRLGIRARYMNDYQPPNWA